MVPFESLGSLQFPIRIPCIYGRVFSRFDAIHKREGQTPHDGVGRANASIARQKLSEKVKSATVNIVTRKRAGVVSTNV